MPTLRVSVIKLASEHPELRKHLVPILRLAVDFPSQAALDKYLKDHPKANKSNHSVKEDSKKAPSSNKSKGKAKPPQDLAKSMDGVRLEGSTNYDGAYIEMADVSYDGKGLDLSITTSGIYKQEPNKVKKERAALEKKYESLVRKQLGDEADNYDFEPPYFDDKGYLQVHLVLKNNQTNPKTQPSEKWDAQSESKKNTEDKQKAKEQKDKDKEQKEKIKQQKEKIKQQKIEDAQIRKEIRERKKLEPKKTKKQLREEREEAQEREYASRRKSAVAKEILGPTLHAITQGNVVLLRGPKGLIQDQLEDLGFRHELVDFNRKEEWFISVQRWPQVRDEIIALANRAPEDREQKVDLGDGVYALAYRGKIVLHGVPRDIEHILRSAHGRWSPSVDAWIIDRKVWPHVKNDVMAALRLR